jgi:hypothetical protein
MLDVTRGGGASASGGGRQGKCLSSVARVRKRPTSANQIESELPILATKWSGSRANRSQTNCTTARTEPLADCKSDDKEEHEQAAHLYVLRGIVGRFGFQMRLRWL